LPSLRRELFQSSQPSCDTASGVGIPLAVSHAFAVPSAHGHSLSFDLDSIRNLVTQRSAGKQFEAHMPQRNRLPGTAPLRTPNSPTRRMANPRLLQESPVSPETRTTDILAGPSPNHRRKLRRVCRDTQVHMLRLRHHAGPRPHAHPQASRYCRANDRQPAAGFP